MIAQTSFRHRILFALAQAAVTPQSSWPHTSAAVVQCFLPKNLKNTAPSVHQHSFQAWLRRLPQPEKPAPHAAAVSQEQCQRPNEGPHSNIYFVMCAACGSIMLHLRLQLCPGLMCHNHGHLVLQMKNKYAAAIKSAMALTWRRMLQLRMQANAPQHVLHEICMCHSNQGLSGSVINRLLVQFWQCCDFLHSD